MNSLYEPKPERAPLSLWICDLLAGLAALAVAAFLAFDLWVLNILLR